MDEHGTTFVEHDSANLRMQYEQLQPGGFEADDIMPQGEKTMNCNVDPSLLQTRSEWSGELDKDKRFGSVVGASTVCDILGGEAVFYKKFGDGSRVASNFSHGGSDGPVVFSSLNGEPIEGESQQEVEDTFAFAGFAKIPWFYNNPNQPEGNGVSVRVGGTGTTMNTGTKEVHVGDLMIWRFPSIDYEEREEEKKRLPTINGHDNQKIYPIWEPFDYREVTHLTYNSMSVLLSDTTGNETSLRLLDIDDMVSEMPAEHEVALLMKHDMLMSLLSGVATLEQYGLVTINVPNTTDSLNSSAYRAWDRVLSTGLKDLNKHDVKATVSRTGTSLEIDYAGVSDKAGRANKLQFLAYKLGLLYDAQRPHLQPAHTMATAVIGRVGYGNLASPKDRAAFTLAATLPGHSRKRARDGEIHYKETTFAGQIARHEAEAKIDACQAQKLASERQDSKIGFKATSHAFTGEILDYAKA